MEKVVLTSLSPSVIHLDFFEKQGSPIYQWEVKRDGGVACRTDVGRALKECFDTHARHGVNHYTVEAIGTAEQASTSIIPQKRSRKNVSLV